VSVEEQNRKHEELLAELAANAGQIDKLKKQAKDLKTPQASEQAATRLAELEALNKSLNEAAKVIIQVNK